MLCPAPRLYAMLRISTQRNATLFYERMTVKTAIAQLESISAYSQSRAHQTPELDKELKDAYEKRTWRERAHCTDDGHVFIPPMAFKQALDAAVKFVNEKIPGQRNATWTKHFVSGILVVDGLVLPTKKDDLIPEWVYCNADGVRGSGKRVMRCFPMVPKWSGQVTYMVLDDLITEDIFARVLEVSGQMVGIGRFRPQNGGFLGRFKVNGLKWK